MAGQHHRCNEHEFGQTLGDGDRQAWHICSPRGRKGNQATEQQQYKPIFYTNINIYKYVFRPLYV